MKLVNQQGKALPARPFGEAVRGLRLTSITLFEQDIHTILNMHEMDAMKYFSTVKHAMVAPTPEWMPEAIDVENQLLRDAGEDYLSKMVRSN